MTEDRGAAESRAMEQVAFRLREAFASRVPDREIDERVREAYHRFDGSKVREFIPLLVENTVRRELLAGLQAAPAGTDSASTAPDGTDSDGTTAEAARPEPLVA